MNDTVLADTAHRLFAERFTPEALRAADQGLWLGDAWAAIAEMGLPLAMVPEEAGGFGVDMTDALDLIRIAGFHAAPVPLAETMLASWLLARTGLEIPAGPLSIAPTQWKDDLTLTRNGAGWRLAGTVQRVPWGRVATAVALLAEHETATFAVRLDAGDWTAEEGRNIAGEPRDTLKVDVALDASKITPAAPGLTGAQLFAMGAGLRCLAMAGAIDRALEMTLKYAEERVQFGRPLGKFQAVQQNLAVLAGQAAAAGAAADGAAEAIAEGASGLLRILPIAAGKQRCSEAAGLTASIAHQMHGAIGFTHEHMLHHLTRRLWSWRDEFGNEAFWAFRIGRQIATAGADGLWPLVTAA